MRLLLILALLRIAASAAETNQLRPWNDYRTILWLSDNAWKDRAKIPLVFERLKEMGINTAMVHGDGDLRPLTESKFPYYVENMINRGLCLKFSSKVTDWERFVTDWAKNGRPEEALKRDYCFDDPQYLGWARREMQNLVRKNRPNSPIAYDIRDELSTTISANPFDYDFNPLALDGFRSWLKTQYADLAALNAEWETSFKSWDDVKPFTTDQIKNRMVGGAPNTKPDWAEIQHIRYDPAKALENPSRWNFAPWADFRTYMDISLARTLSDLRSAAHELDPQTPVGIEGAQMPSAFGGYDLWRLSQALDWVEPYDIACSREIFGSFMPHAPFMATIFEKTTEPAARRLWHLLLEGDLACIVWWSEDCIDWKNPDYPLTPKAKALAPALREMTSPLAQLFLRAERVRDPIYIYYSQPSIQADWLIESTRDGSTWLRRFSSFEADHNQAAKTRAAWLKLFQDAGWSPQFISAEQLKNGALRNATNLVLVLPTCYALSDSEIKQFNDFAKNNRVFADGTPGAFDEHCRLRSKLPFAENFIANGATAFGNGKSSTIEGAVADYLRERLTKPGVAHWPLWIGLEAKLGSPEVRLPSENIRVHRFQSAHARLLAFERNILYQMSEDLKQAGGNEPLEKTIDVKATLQKPAHVYDLRAEKYLGLIQNFTFTLDPWRPSLFAVTAEKLPNGPVLEALNR